MIPVGDPMSMLHAALSTERPQLLDAFVKQMKASTAEEGASPEVAHALVDVVQELSSQILCYRRAERAHKECALRAHQALRGVESALALHRCVDPFDLPEGFSGEKIVAGLKKRWEDQRASMDG